MASPKIPANDKIEILIVEDSPIQLELLRKALVRQGYIVTIAKNGAEGLEKIRKRKPTLVISDIAMPVMDGYQMCREIKHDKMLDDIPVMLFTALSESEDVIRGLECGADNFIVKSCEEKYLLTRIEYLLVNRRLRRDRRLKMGIEIYYSGKNYILDSDQHQIMDMLMSTFEHAVRQNRELTNVQIELKALNEQLEEKVKERTAALTAEIVQRKRVEEKLRKAMEGTIQTIALMMEMRDPCTAGHERRVAWLACAIAREMGLSEEQIEGIRVSGFLHDIGKIVVPTETLNKDRISEHEFNLIKTHVQVGYDILKGLEFPWPVAQAVLQHHERLDGSGYPAGLLGDEIILEARLLGVADVVESMASSRSNRPVLGLGEALEEILEGRDVLYDPQVVDVYLKLFTEKGLDTATFRQSPFPSKG